jgi:hypothetical protein
MRLVLVPLLLSGTVFMGIAGCPPTDDCTPPHDGYLLQGTWGGQDWQFDVDAEEYAEIQTYCATGRSDSPVKVMDGQVSFSATMQQPAGPGYVTFHAKFTGTVCDTTLEFTYTTDTGVTETGSVVYGQPGELPVCPIL